MSEYEETKLLANRILERPNCDPDDDLCMLARQFLRGDEIVQKLKRQLADQHDPMLELIEANRDSILKKHEEAFGLINRVLIGGGSQHDAEKLIYIGKVLHALSVFHPMHGESWKGWPE